MGLPTRAPHKDHSRRTQRGAPLRHEANRGATLRLIDLARSSVRHRSNSERILATPSAASSGDPAIRPRRRAPTPPRCAGGEGRPRSTARHSGGGACNNAPLRRAHGAAHHSKMGDDMATREFGRQGGLVRGFLGVARHGGCSSVHLARFPKVLRIAPELGDRESSSLHGAAVRKYDTSEVLRLVSPWRPAAVEKCVGDGCTHSPLPSRARASLRPRASGQKHRR